MKMLRLTFLLLAIPSFGQIYSGSPAIYPTGQPLANTPIAICSSDPGRTTPPCLGSLAQTYMDETFTTACTLLPTPGSPLGPISGLNCTNPGISTEIGNWSVFLNVSSNYFAQFYPTGISPTVVPFTINSANNPVFTGTITLPITGSTQCLHVLPSGLVQGTGADCGAGGGGGGNAQVIITTGTTPLTVLSPDLSTSLAFNMSSGSNPSVSSSTNLVNFSSLIIGDLAGTGSSCLHADSLGNITRTGTDCATTTEVTSFSGDGALINNSGATGAVSVTLGTAGAHTYWGNNTGSTGAPSYSSLVAADLPSIPGHQIAAPLSCADSSGSGTAQSCTTSPSFTPVANDCIVYTTTTANTGTGLTLNVNSLGAKSVAKWLSTTTLAANDVLANKEILTCYDGTNWELHTIGNAPASSGNVSTSSNLVNGNLVVATGTTTVADSGFSQSGGTLGLGANGGSSGVLQLNGSSSGNCTQTVSATGTTVTLGGSSCTTLIPPNGSATAVSIGSSPTTGIYGLNGALNYSTGGVQAFGATSNQVTCYGTNCRFQVNGFANLATFQSGTDNVTAGTTGGAVSLRSANITSGTTTASSTGTLTAQSGDNAATGGAVQTVGDSFYGSGGFTGASGAATAWVAGHTIGFQQYWADTTTTTGTLACYTTPGSNGQMPKVGTCTATSNVPWIGIITSTNGQAVKVIRSGHVSGVVSHASATDTAGYFVCIDTSNAGDVLVQSTSCPAGQSVGVIDQTGSGGTTHNVDISALPEEVGASSGVSSLTGDGSLITNSASTGAVTLTLGTAGAHKYFGNNTGSTAAPSYLSIVSGDLPASIAANTSGSAASLSISGQTGLMTVTGLTSTNRAKTVRDAADTILELGGSYTPTGTWTWTSCSSCVWPTFNQNTTGTAANLSGTPALPNGTTATTQSSFAGDTKLATDNYVDLQTKPVYSLVATGVTLTTGTGVITGVTGTGCTSGVCTMLTPASDGYYRFTDEVIATTAGVGCTGGTVQLQITYTSADSNTAITNSPVATRTASAQNSLLASMTPSTTGIGGGTDWIAVPLEFRVKASTAIKIQLNQTAGESGCSTIPIVTLRAALYGPLGY